MLRLREAAGEHGGPAMTNGTPERPLTVAQLAEHWQVSDTFIYDEIKAGRLEAFKLGGKLWRVSPQAVVAYEDRAGSG